MKIAVNGCIIDEREAVVSVYDHGFLYGMGLFETFRTYGGRPFLLKEHLARLAAGLDEIGIRAVPDADGIRELVGKLLAANGLTDAYIRLSVSAGAEALGLPSGDYRSPNTIVYIKPLPPRDESVYTDGKPIQLLALRRNSPEGMFRMKSFHYMNNILAKREMARYPWAGGAEGIFLDGRGYLSEGIVSNLFWIKDRTCFTPSEDTGLLPGITRRFVMKLAEAEGLRVEEGLYRWEDVLEADEAFLTNSIQEIVPVRCGFDLQGKEKVIRSRGAGPVTRRLMGLYSRETEAESKISSTDE
jgi:4-amino-4-deoxychorismate lyase